MENKIKNLKKQCPICGKIIDASLDYCPKCDSYVGDVIPIDDQKNDQKKFSEELTSGDDFDSSSTTDKSFEELDTILSDSQKDENNITFDELTKLLAANGQTVNGDVRSAESKPQANAENDVKHHTPTVNSSEHPPKRKEIYKKKRRGFFSNSKNIDENSEPQNDEDELEKERDVDSYTSVDEIKDHNAPEKIIINTQVDELEGFNSDKSKPEKKLHQNPSADNFFHKYLRFFLNSLKSPSLKTSSKNFLNGIITLVIEFIFFAFSLQLLYNSGLQMSDKGNNKPFGQYLVHALDLNNKHNIFELLLILLFAFLLIPILGILFDKFLIRDRDFSIKLFIAQFSRYSMFLLPISILTFIYSLFNSPFVTKLVLILICLAPIILILAVSLYLLQLKGEVLFDRVYIISLYFAVSMIVIYLLFHSYFLNFANSFTNFLG